MKNTTTENLPEEFHVKANDKTKEFFKHHFNATTEDEWNYVIKTKRSTNASYNSDIDEFGILIPLEEFYKLTGINGKVTPKAKPKNLILKKDMPSVFSHGKEYKRKKGIVYFNDGGEWDLIKGVDFINSITPEDYEANKEWYGMTSKAHTYEIYKVNGDEVKFEEGQIRVGCQTIPNDVVKAIAKNLINNQ